MKNNHRLNGIQHLGIGTSNFKQNWVWLKDMFGFDIPMFDSVALADLMVSYTNGVSVNKRAAMILNLQGGCPVELIELRSESPRHALEQTKIGDLGIFAGKIKVAPEKLNNSLDFFKEKSLSQIVRTTPNGQKTVFLNSPDGLLFQVIEGDKEYMKGHHRTSGIGGCMIGVSDMERSKDFYRYMGYTKLIYEEEGCFDDLKNLPGGDNKFKRCLLKKDENLRGGFSKLSGESYIELFQVLDRKPKAIFENRIWGDVGFVHLGMDVRNMDSVEDFLTSKGYPFVCDSSNGLHMGQTRVHCVYVEDPDGALIELIEVYKIPIIEKINLFLNVEKRAPETPLPNWLIKGMRFMRIKDNYWDKKNI